jgi:O-antigen ligase
LELGAYLEFGAWNLEFKKMRLLIKTLIYILLIVTPLILVRAIYYTAVNAKLFFSEFLIVIIIALWLLTLLWKKPSKEEGGGKREDKASFFLAQRSSFIHQPFTIPLLLFAGWIMFRNLFSPIMFLSWKESLLMLLWVGLYFVCVDVFREKKSMLPVRNHGNDLVNSAKESSNVHNNVSNGVQLALWCMLGTGTIVACYGILQYFGYDPMPWSGRIAPKGKDIVISTFGNANYVAEYLQPVAIIALTWFIFNTTKLWAKVLASIIAIILLTCVVISGAREAWIGLPVVALIGWTLLRKSTKYQVQSTNEKNMPSEALAKDGQNLKSKIQNKVSLSKKWLIVLLVILIIVVSVVVVKSSRHPGWLKQQVYSLSDVHQFQERFLIWQIGFQMIQEHPVWGLGAGGFRINFMDKLAQFMDKPETQIYIPTVNGWQGSNANQSHNDYLQLTVDFGLVGIGLFFWFIATFIWIGINAIKTSDNPIEKLQVTGLFLALVAILIDATVNFPFMLPGNGLLFWILLALFNNCIDNEVPSTKYQVQNRITKIPVRIIGSVIVLILSMVFLTSIYRSVQASVLLKKGRKEVMSGQLQPALELLQKSVQLDPIENETRFVLGLVYQQLGQLDQAVQQYTQAYGYDYRKYVNLGETYFLLKNYPAAVGELEQAARVYPADPESPQILATIYSRYLNQPDKAIQYYEQYLNLAIYPEDAVAVVNELKQLKDNVKTKE